MKEVAPESVYLAMRTFGEALFLAKLVELFA
jgi:hypothetical protein